MDSCDIAWAAGLFEGEGSIVHLPYHVDRKRTDHVATMRRLTVTSTDLDVLERFREVVEVGSIRVSHPNNKKVAYTWTSNSWPDVEMVLNKFLPYFGSRRKAKAEALLADPATRPRRFKGEKIS